MKKPAILTALIVCFIVTLSGCGGTKVSRFSYDESYQINQTNKSEDCYDSSILLGVDIHRAKDISMKVIVAIDATILEESMTFIKAQRNRHIGIFVGSGGEQLFITLQEISINSSFISVATKTGFVGGAGQKAWSCIIVDEMTKMASK
jgi:hypothetical protein